jgi:hypothetical protein
MGVDFVWADRMTNAAVLYHPDAAWQSPRVPKEPGAVDAIDPPSQRTHAEKLLSDRVEQIVKLAGLFLATLAALAAPHVLYNDRITALETSIKSLTQTVTDNDKHLDDRLNVIGNWLKDPTKFPGGSAIPAPLSPAPSASAINSAPSAVPQGLKGFPSNVAPISAPECVSSKTFNKMPCELAGKDACRGLNSFTPQRYREIRLQAGVGEYMLVCDEKTP